MDIKEVKKNILEYDLYEVLDDIPYGNYSLTILNGNYEIMIVVYDDQGFASGTMDKEEFLNISTNEELEQRINSILYYNYIEDEGE